MPPEEMRLEIDFPFCDRQRMFCSCELIKEIDIVKFDTSKVTNMSQMFSDCDFLIKEKFYKFDASKINNMSCMFYNAVL